jgi:hypothetical protein
MAPTATGRPQKYSRTLASFKDDAERIAGVLSTRHKSVLLLALHHMAEYRGFGGSIMKRMKIVEATMRPVAEAGGKDANGSRKEARVVCEVVVDRGALLFLLHAQLDSLTHSL